MTRKAVVQKEPLVAPGRAVRALTHQLDELQKLKNRNYQEAEAEEAEWEHSTQGLIETAFADPRPILDKFYIAGASGQHILGDVSLQQRQMNFELRVREYDALLRGLIGVLRLQLTE
jgi:hypothetical protein